ncbi:MAG: hypothetical protein JSW00_18955 [Thermoplasmata archaeon]|nr:MAG: hypothetical protein JSW00_18955 [Thermoplasmata archaeon]
MPKCPICNEELVLHDENNMLCKGCGETIPKDFVKESKVPCCNPLYKCK